VNQPSKTLQKLTLLNMRWTSVQSVFEVLPRDIYSDGASCKFFCLKIVVLFIVRRWRRWKDKSFEFQDGLTGKGPSIYDVHMGGEGVRLMWTHVDWGGVSSM